MDLSLIGWIVIGLLAGALAGFLVPGRERFGCIGTILVGVAGGLLGGWLWTGVLGNEPAGGFLSALFVAIIGSVIVLFILRLVARR